MTRKQEMMNAMNVIASVFGACHGEKTSQRCRGKYARTVDYSISFDNGERLFICNSSSGWTFDQHIKELCKTYNPDTVQETKQYAFKWLRERSALDNAIAEKRIFLPHDVLSIELNTTDKNGYMGWYYVKLMVGGNIISHVETGTNHDIRQRKLSVNVRENYFVAGGLMDKEVDYIFNGVGFSSKSPLYKMNKDTIFHKMI